MASKKVTKKKVNKSNKITMTEKELRNKEACWKATGKSEGRVELALELRHLLGIDDAISNAIDDHENDCIHDRVGYY